MIYTMTYNLKIIEDFMQAIPVSYNTLSEKTGLPASKLKNYIHNVTEPPLIAIVKLADFFQVPIDVLIGRCTEEEYANFMKGFKPAFMKLESEAYDRYLLKRYGYGPHLMPNEHFKVNDYIASYPYNLLDTVFKEPIKFFLTGDQLDAFDYVMSTLTEREVEAIKLYYEQGFTLEETGAFFNLSRERARQIIARGIRKLRHPTRLNLIMYGLEGGKELNEWNTKQREMVKQYRAEYNEKKQAWLEKINAIDNPPEHEEQETVPTISDFIDNMDLSVRSYNCLARHFSHWDALKKTYNRHVTISDVIDLIRSGKLLMVRNLGKKSAVEILTKLEELYNVSLWEYCPELEEYRKESA